MKAVLQCNKHFDGSNVLEILYRKGIEVLKTKTCGFGMEYKITIRIGNQRELGELMHEMNGKCDMGVVVVKTKGK